MGLSRRDFIRQMTALGFTAAAASAMFSLLGCRPGEETPFPTSSITPTIEEPPESVTGTPIYPSSTVPAVTPSSTPATSQIPSSTSVVTQTTPTVVVPTFPSTTSVPTQPTFPVIEGTTYLAVARGSSPKAMVEAVIRSLGGIERFVKSGNDVIIKPNVCVAYHTYEYAATTNPEVVGTLVELCKSAGARRVRVMDQPFGGTAEQAYARCGIGEAVRMAGGQMEVMSSFKFKETPIPSGKDITTWPVYADILNADVVINVPIAKHHNLARLTLGMKNLMGVIQKRNEMHFNLGQRVADLASLVRPAVTVVDAVRILMNNGPSGGNLADVKLTNTVIASHDIVAADAYAATLFGLTGVDIPAIRAGAQMGLGTMDLKSIRIEEINV